MYKIQEDLTRNRRHIFIAEIKRRFFLFLFVMIVLCIVTPSYGIETIKNIGLAISLYTIIYSYDLSIRYRRKYGNSSIVD